VYFELVLHNRRYGLPRTDRHNVCISTKISIEQPATAHGIAANQRRCLYASYRQLSAGSSRRSSRTKDAAKQASQVSTRAQRISCSWFQLSTLSSFDGICTFRWLKLDLSHQNASRLRSCFCNVTWPRTIPVITVVCLGIDRRSWSIQGMFL
jgi:hypothetical protein